ncbi:uncharacterized protein LOC133321817 [Musca vetustissima]|uniref:uncharacterized protein LOC133321817 n=1 Tax=Musca vetustissima TaxID=27455 RepID=UPI002AB764F3|nr:uncharacterized protein LOC133321817 [Musca vetustissima]
MATRHSTDDQDFDLISNVSGSYKRDNFIFRIWNFKRKKKSSHILDKFWQHQDTTYAKLSNGNNGESFSDIQLQNLDVTNLLITTGHTKESSVNYIPSRVPSSRASSSLDLEWEHEYSQMRHYQQHMIKQRTQMLQTYQQLQMMDSKPCDETSADESWHYVSHEEDQLNSMASMSSMAELPSEAEIELAARQRSHKTKDSQRSGERRALLRSNSRLQRSITRNSSHNSWSHISTPESLEWDVDEEQQRQLHVEDDNLDHETLKLLHQIEQLKNRVLYETGEGLYADPEESFMTTAISNYRLNNMNVTASARTTGGAVENSTALFHLGDSDGENGNYR